MAEFIKIRYKVLSLERKDNQYSKYLKWVLRYIIEGINPAEDAKLIPCNERQQHEEWYKTRTEAERQKAFYDNHYQSDWSSGSWRKREVV